MKNLNFLYAHIEVLVTFLLVKVFSILDITRSQDLRFGRNLVDMNPSSPPDLFNQLPDLNKSQKPPKNRKQNFQTI